MSSSSPPIKIFVCHAHADKPMVRGLVDRLIADGITVWLDERTLLPGQRWKAVISKAVRESDVVIVFFSRNFHSAGFRWQEVEWAHESAMRQPPETIYLIPAKLDDYDVPDKFMDLQWVNLFEPSGYEWLLEALKFRAQEIKQAQTSGTTPRANIDPRPFPPSGPTATSAST